MVRCPTEHDLERLVHGDLAAAEAARIRLHAEACPTCSRWLEGASADSELEESLARVLSAGAPGEPPRSLPGLARYRIVGRLGSGGMGVVWEAEQESPRRRVALKLLRPGLVSERALARFAHEVETLARLSHPGIARIIEAGSFESHGERQPFFAMELVDGVAIDRFAADLDGRARVELFALVCDAVAHAHVRGVLHRDVKPSNVLVTREGRPVVVDFGVARAVELGEERVTRTGEMVGTLAFASPEQLRGDDGAVDTRTDVWGLGALFVTLLTGAPPFDLAGLSPERAAERASTAPRPELPGDLGAIVRTALAPEPDLRYSSASALADDVRRALAGEPVAARPPSAWRLVARLLRRHRLASTAALAALLALLLGSAVAAWQAVRARRAEVAAHVESVRHEAVSDFLVDLLRASDPLSGMPAGTTVLDVLARAEERLTDAPPLDAPTEAELRLAVGRALRSFRAYERALPHLERARALARELPRAFAGDVESELAALHYDTGEFAAAATRFEAAIAAWEAAGAPAGRVADGWAHLGAARLELGRRDDAAAALERAREVRASAGLEETGSTDVFRARLLFAERRYDEARSAAEAALEHLARRGAEDEYSASIAHELLAAVAAATGDEVAAERHARRTIEIDELRYGPDHPAVATELVDLAHFLHDAGRNAEALELAERALSITRSQETLFAYARVGRTAGRAAEAQAAAEEAWSLARSTGAPTTAGTRAALLAGNGLLDAEPARAEQAFRFVVEDVGAELDPVTFLRASRRLGSLRERRDDAPGAIEAFRAALAVPGARDLDRITHDEARFYLARLLRHDAPAEAEALHTALLADGMERFAEAIARTDLGWIHLTRGDAAGADELFARALDDFESIDGVEPRVLASARRNLATSRCELDDLHGARALFEAAAAVLGPELEAQGPNGERILAAYRLAGE